MTFTLTFVLFSVLASATFVCPTQKYAPDWDSLDARPVPQWYDHSKVGILMHWGVYSVPAFGSEWFWRLWKLDKRADVLEYIDRHYPPNFTYEDFAPHFRAQHYDPNEWAALFAKSGARYVVLTAKHHDGYTLWPSTYSPHWNSADVGPKRDLIGEFADAIRNHSGALKLGLYYSLMEWFHPLYLSDRANHWQTSDYVRHKARPEMEQLVQRYRPDLFFADGDKGSPESYWNSTDFVAWLYNQPHSGAHVVINDRWGDGTRCRHGGYLNCDERNNNAARLMHRKWENVMSLDKTSWCFRSTASVEDYFSVEELLKILVKTVAYGGNILINVGPNKEGRIPALQEERLLQLGQWLAVNGEAIYESSVWTQAQQDSIDSNVYYTEKGNQLYGLLTEYPPSGVVQFGGVNFANVKSVSLLGYRNNGDIRFEQSSDGKLLVNFPSLTPVDTETVRWVYVFKIDRIQKETSKIEL